MSDLSTGLSIPNQPGTTYAPPPRLFSLIFDRPYALNITNGDAGRVTEPYKEVPPITLNKAFQLSFPPSEGSCPPFLAWDTLRWVFPQ